MSDPGTVGTATLETADRRARQLEIALVFATAAVFAVLPKPPAATLPMAVFIPACMGAWLAFFAWRLRGDPALLDRWGLRPSTDLGPLVTRLGPLLVAAVGGGALYARATGGPLVPAYLGVSLLLYPLWGLVQQWLVQALLVDNVRALTGAGLPWLVALGALGFGAIHFEHPLLVLATAILGGVYVALFQRWRNLWPLGICHGWLGSLFYPWVLHQNPTEQLMGLLG